MATHEASDSAHIREVVDLQQIVETQRALAAADLDLGTIMTLICARTQELTGAEGAAVLLGEGEELLTYAAGSGSLESNVGETVPIRGSTFGATLLQDSAMVGKLADGRGLGVPLLRGDRSMPCGRSGHRRRVAVSFQRRVRLTTP